MLKNNKKCPECGNKLEEHGSVTPDGNWLLSDVCYNCGYDKHEVVE